MSSLVLGTAQFGLNYGVNNKNGKTGISEVLGILSLAQESGINEIDTAQEYGDAETILGMCLKTLPKDFIVHSKFILSEEPIQTQIERSLEILGIGQLGYFYFHRFSDYQFYVSQQNQHIHFNNCLGLGVSVYDEDELELCLNDSIIKAIQVPMNVFDCSNRKIELIKLAQHTGKKIYIRSVFLQGLFFMNIEDLPSKLNVFSTHLKYLNEIARDHKVDVRALALGFVKAMVQDLAVVIGVETSKHLAENISAWNTDLNTEIVQDLRRINIEDRHLLLPKNWN